MNRRQFIIAGTAGLTALAGCSGSDLPTGNESEPSTAAENELRTEIVETTNAATVDFAQADRELGSAQVLSSDEKWERAVESAGDAVDAFAAAEDKFRTAVSRAEELGNLEIKNMLNEYEEASSTGGEVATLVEEGCEFVINGDTDSAQSRFEEVEERRTELQDYNLASESELNSAMRS